MSMIAKVILAEFKILGNFRNHHLMFKRSSFRTKKPKGYPTQRIRSSNVITKTLLIIGSLMKTEF